MKKIKKGTLLVASALVCSMLAGCSVGTVKEPTFEEDEFVFSAYAAPTIRGGVGDLEELDDAYKKLSEAGITKAFALFEGASGATGEDIYETIKLRSKKAEETALTVLDIAEKYGVKYWVRDWSFYGLGTNFDEIKTKEDMEKVIAEMFTKENPYINHPAYGGNFGYDEPQAGFALETVGWQAELYNKYIKENSENGGEMYVNLFPSHAVTDYASYVDYYFENVAPHTGYVCWDHYPFINNGTENLIKGGYYANLELMAKKCKEYDVELRAFVQLVSDFAGLRELDGIADIRFQAYSCMAFGARELVYYCYSTPVNESNPTDIIGYGIYDYMTGKYSWLYDATKQVNGEIHAMDDAYMAYDWEGVMFKNASEIIDNQLFANLASPMESHERMEIVSCSQDAMAGVFTAKDKKSDAQDAFMVVNVTDPIEKLDNEVTLKFHDAKALLMYRHGEKQIVELGRDGEYTLLLEPGEGRFIIPLK